MRVRPQQIAVSSVYNGVRDTFVRCASANSSPGKREITHGPDAHERWRQEIDPNVVSESPASPFFLDSVWSIVKLV